MQYLRNYIQVHRTITVISNMRNIFEPFKYLSSKVITIKPTSGVRRIFFLRAGIKALFPLLCGRAYSGPFREKAIFCPEKKKILRKQNSQLVLPRSL